MELEQITFQNTFQNTFTNLFCEYIEKHIISFLNDKDTISIALTTNFMYKENLLNISTIRNKYMKYKSKYHTLVEALERIHYKNRTLTDTDKNNIRSDITYMIKSGLWDIHKENSLTNRNPLYVTTSRNDMEFTKLIIANGGNIHGSFRNRGYLWWCTMTHTSFEKNTETINYLLEKKVDMYEETKLWSKYEYTTDVFSYLLCRHFSFKYDILLLFLEKGYDINKFKVPYDPFRWKELSKFNVFELLFHLMDSNKESFQRVDQILILIKSKFPDYFNRYFFNASFHKIKSITTMKTKLMIKHGWYKHIMKIFYKKGTACILDLLLKNRLYDNVNDNDNELYNFIINKNNKDSKKIPLENTINKYGSFDEKNSFVYKK